MPACRIRFLNRARVKRFLGVITDPPHRAIFEGIYRRAAGFVRQGRTPQKTVRRQI